MVGELIDSQLEETLNRRYWYNWP